MTISSRTHRINHGGSRTSRLATCTFGMPLESTQAGWYVTVGFDAALAVLFISATRFKMPDKSVPHIIGTVAPETMDRLQACPTGDFPGVVITPGVTYIWLLSEMWAHPSRALIKWRLRAGRVVGPSSFLRLASFHHLQFSWLLPLVAIWDVWIAVYFRRWRGTRVANVGLWLRALPAALFVWSTGQRWCAKLRPRRLSPLVDVFSWSSRNSPTEMEVRLRG